MRRYISTIGIFLSILTLIALADSKTFYDLSAISLDGQKVALKAYQGKVILVVNTASQCGFTPQYEGLENLYKQYQQQGLVVLGFPSNDFGGQEPGTSQEIKEFCSSKFHVTFPMFAKVHVRKGPEQSPIYQFLSSNGNIPRWNFGKYLISKQGQVINFFGSTTSPDSTKLITAIEAALQ